MTDLGSPDDIPRDLAERPVRERDARRLSLAAVIIAALAIGLLLGALWMLAA